MFASVICVAIKGTVDSGGFGEVWEIARLGNCFFISTPYKNIPMIGCLIGGRIQFADLNVDPTVRQTLWTQLIGGLFTFVSLYAVNQTQV